MSICFHCGKKIDPFAIGYMGFALEDGKPISIGFHSVCRGEFAKILIDTFLKDERFREKQKQNL